MNARIRSWPLAAFLLCLCLVAAAWAEEDVESPSGEDAQQTEEASVGFEAVGEGELEEIVVTGTRTRHALSDSPVAVDLVTQEEIERSGSKDAGDALESIPGVFVDDFESAGRGGPGTGINLQGLPTDRVLVLMDGQRIPMAMRAPDLELIPGNIVQRIEVVKGPSSALYGSDAVGGVINIITRDPSEALALEGGVGYGSFNTYRGDVLHSATFGPFGYLAAFNREASDGWIDKYTQKGVVRMGLGIEDFLLVENEKDHPHEVNDAFGTVELGLGQRVKWNAQARFHDENDQFWDADDGSVDSFTTRLDLQTGFDFDLGSAGTLWIRGYGFRHYFRFRRFESAYVYDLLEPEIINRSYIDKGNDTIRVNTRGEAVHSVALGTWNLLTSGLDVRHETIEYDATEISVISDEESGYEAWQTIVSGFVQDEMFFLDDRWTVVPGCRVDHHAQWGTVVNPKLATLVKAVTSTDYRLSVRASIGLAFKEPTLSELYRKEFRHTGYYITGNQDLEPEHALGWNAEIEQGFFGMARLTLNYFQYEIDDMIWTEVIDAVYTGGFPLMSYTNVKDARIYGIESSLDLSPMDWLTLQAHHAYTKTIDLQEDDELGTVPQHQAGARIFIDVESWGLGGYLYGGYVGERDYIGMGGLWYTAEPRWTTKARVYKRLFDHLELFLEGANLIGLEWDRDDDGDNDMPPLNLFGGVKAWL